MEPKRTTDHSYGFVAVYRDNEVNRYLLVSHKSDGHWGFPKGHAEGNETPIAAALRELQEECAITDIAVVAEKTFTQTYTFTHGDTVCDKTNTLFLGMVKSTNAISQPEEILECRFMTLSEAEQYGIVENVLAILRDAERVVH